MRPEAVLVSRDRRAPDGPRPVASRALEGRGGAPLTEPPNAAAKVGHRPSSELPGALRAHYGFRPVSEDPTSARGDLWAWKDCTLSN